MLIIKKNKPRGKPFEKGHPFLGDLSKPNYFHKGMVSLRKGVTLTEEQRKKLSNALMNMPKDKKYSWVKKLIESHKGKKQSKELVKKRMKARKGYRHTKETIEKIRNSNLNNGKTRKTDESKLCRTRIEYRLWREAVFARDNWTCQKTGVRGGKLVPHHIKNFAQYPELRFAIDNGVTLNAKVHTAFHKKYGKRDNNMEQLNDFLKGQEIEC